ncbi:response regulator transcription factor [Streptomyces sp. NPDC004050]
MLSALDELADRVAGLQAGAGDYLVKPFALEELVLRLSRAAAPQPAGPSGPAPDTPLRAGPLVVDPATREVHRGGDAVHLTRGVRVTARVAAQRGYSVVPARGPTDGRTYRPGWGDLSPAPPVRDVDADGRAAAASVRPNLQRLLDSMPARRSS